MSSPTTPTSTAARCRSSSVTTPTNGTAVIDPGGGSITYVPNPDATGSDAFSYVVDDGAGGTDQGDVAVTIGPASGPPDAADDSATTDEDTPVTIDVLANDSDPDGDPLTITSVTEPSLGTAVVDGDGTIVYTPDAERQRHRHVRLRHLGRRVRQRQRHGHRGRRARERPAEGLVGLGLGAGAERGRLPAARLRRRDV